MSQMLKCKNCGEWSTHKEENPICPNCQKAFFVVTESEKESLERRRTAGEIKIKIKETDSLIVTIFKHLFNVVQMVFLAIVSFIVWFVAAGPG